MMTKHFANNSVLRRASQFESNSADQQQLRESNRRSIESVTTTTTTSQGEGQQGSIKRPSLSRKKDEQKKETSSGNISSNTTSNNEQQHFISSAYARFEREYARLYPDSALPFPEPNSPEEAKEALRLQQTRAAELSLELSKAKYAVNFLKGITASGNERKDASGTSAMTNGNESYCGSAGLNDTNQCLVTSLLYFTLR